MLPALGCWVLGTGERDLEGVLTCPPEVLRAVERMKESRQSATLGTQAAAKVRALLHTPPGDLRSPKLLLFRVLPESGRPPCKANPTVPRKLESPSTPGDLDELRQTQERQTSPAKRVRRSLPAVPEWQTTARLAVWEAGPGKPHTRPTRRGAAWAL